MERFYKCSKTNPDPDIPNQSSASAIQKRQKVIPPVKVDPEMVPGSFQSCILEGRLSWLHISESVTHRCVLNTGSLRRPKGASNISWFSEADHRNSRKNWDLVKNAAAQAKQTQQKELKRCNMLHLYQGRTMHSCDIHNFACSHKFDFTVLTFINMAEN